MQGNPEVADDHRHRHPHHEPIHIIYLLQPSRPSRLPRPPRLPRLPRLALPGPR